MSRSPKHVAARRPALRRGLACAFFGDFVGLVEDPPAPQRVVDQDDATGAHAGEDLVVVRGVAGLVGVDERQIDRVVERQVAQRLDGRRDAQRPPRSWAAA